MCRLPRVNKINMIPGNDTLSDFFLFRPDCIWPKRWSSTWSIQHPSEYVKLTRPDRWHPSDIGEIKWYQLAQINNGCSITSVTVDIDIRSSTGQPDNLNVSVKSRFYVFTRCRKKPLTQLRRWPWDEPTTSVGGYGESIFFNHVIDFFHKTSTTHKTDSRVVLQSKNAVICLLVK